MTITSSADAPPALRLPLALPLPSPFSTRARFDRRRADSSTSTSSSSGISMGVALSPPLGADRRVPAIWGGGAVEPFTGRWIVPGREVDARSAGCGGGAGVSFLGCAYLLSAHSTRGSSHLNPVLGGRVVLLAIRLVLVRDGGYEWVSGVGVGQEGGEGEDDLVQGEGG